MDQGVVSHDVSLPTSRAESDIAVRAENRPTSLEGLELSIAELRRSNGDLAKFAYIAAHELQSPIQTVGRLAESLRQRSDEGTTEARENYLDIIVKSTRRMAELISDLLRHAQLSSTNPSEGFFEAATAVDVALMNLSALILEADALVTYDVLPAVQVSSAQLLELFQNLIGNAIRYRGTDRSHVHVSAIEENDEYLFSIRDNGIGIHAEYRQCIFEPFKRLHGPERAGNGLGLAVCRQIVERAGGQIWVESELGNGSTFYFTFPKQIPLTRRATESLNITVEHSNAASEVRNVISPNLQRQSDDDLEAVRAKVRDDLEERIKERTLTLQHANQELLAKNSMFQITLACIGDAVITTDNGAKITYLNPVAETLSGWSNTEASGLLLPEVFNILTEATREHAEDPVTNCLKSGEVTRLAGDTLLVRRDGKELSIDDTAAPIFNAAQEMVGAVLIFRDVSDKRRLVEELSHQAMQDALTGLKNRRGFERYLNQVLDSPEAHQRSALLYLDLDQFKVVNDTGGHAAGDALLRQLGALMQAQIRSGDTLARLGGDEFGILLQNCPREQARRVANQLRETIENFRFGWESKFFTIGVSVGVVPIPQAGGSLSNLLVAADVACYAAKESGGNRVHVYDLDDNTLVERHGDMQWVGRINDALQEDRLCLYYQPIVPLGINPISGQWGEILVRLLDADGHLVLPGSFTPAAERYGLMTAVDRWVFRHSLEALQLRPSTAGPTTYSINVSGQSLGDESFLDFILEEFRRTKVHPAKVCLEITETAAIASLSHATRLISVLKDMGCLFALDDFGTGLSSFAYLRSLSVDYLKLAGRFVKDIATDPIDYAMARGIHHIGQVMGIQTVAEHVEDDASVEALKEIGVEYAQGNMMGRPTAIKAKAAVT
jgi:diguanylate cyclase (GGDEF)-like protein/PAS domain S-box-containing protein